MVSITKISSKGQIVIPQEIREKMKLEEGNMFIISELDNSICLKKLDIPKTKTWDEVTKPFREAAKRSGFSQEDLERVIAESRASRKNK